MTPRRFKLTMWAMGLAVIVVAVASVLSERTPPAPAVVDAAQSGDVARLVERLAPLSFDSKSSWMGVRIVFSGGGVEVSLKLWNGDEVHSEAKTLDQAVAQLGAPNQAMVEALQAWREGK